MTAPTFCGVGLNTLKGETVAWFAYEVPDVSLRFRSHHGGGASARSAQLVSTHAAAGNPL
jgi:hypothetical protein